MEKFVEGPLPVVNLLRFAHELRDASALDVDAGHGFRTGVSEVENRLEVYDTAADAPRLQGESAKPTGQKIDLLQRRCCRRSSAQDGLFTVSLKRNAPVV